MQPKPKFYQAQKQLVYLLEGLLNVGNRREMGLSITRVRKYIGTEEQDPFYSRYYVLTLARGRIEKI